MKMAGTGMRGSVPRRRNGLLLRLRLLDDRWVFARWAVRRQQGLRPGRDATISIGFGDDEDRPSGCRGRIDEGILPERARTPFDATKTTTLTLSLSLSLYCCR